MKLVDRSAQRLFTFGCSFTKYHWTTWPEIVAYELNVPLYNYGRSGAGNQYIANMISQADAIHNFNENDLIMISWTNVCREDRYKNQNWITPGNIFSQNIYSNEYVKKWADPAGYILRDLCTIKFTINFLENKKCQFHMMSMCDIVDTIDQGQAEILKNLSFKEEIIKMYKNELDQLHSDFYNVLWQNNPQTYKFPKDMKEISELFSDGHPTPIEHLEYLQNIFSNTFSEKTSDAVKEKYSFFIQSMKRLALHYNRKFTVYELSDYENNLLRKGTTLVESEETKFI
jgi:adenylate kinase family enzyme